MYNAFNALDVHVALGWAGGGGRSRGEGGESGGGLGGGGEVVGGRGACGKGDASLTCMHFVVEIHWLV